MNQSITRLKALGIMLMVLGHSMCSIPYAIAFLSMFHMPLFFITSGYCFKEKYLSDFKAFIARRIKGLYVPFVKWSLIFALLYRPFFALHLYDEKYGFNGVGAVYESWQGTLHSCWIIVTQMRGMCWLLAGYWFLNALFFGSIIAWIVLRLSKRTEYAFAVSLLLLFVVHVTQFHVVFLNLNTRAFAAATLFVAGHLMCKRELLPFGWTGIVLSLALTACGMFYWPLAIDHLSYEGWNLFPHLLTATLATWSFYSLFVRWSSLKNDLLDYIGTETMTILTWHLLSFKAVSLLIILIYGLPIEQLGEFPVIVEYATGGWWMLYFAAGVGLPLLMKKFMDFFLHGMRRIL